ncbi:MAG TPA: hypothetical protein DCF63_19695 [Planctomycetaceae bacterium]|nr:hypothetical protein [Planctomycetaceae bacterium]
MGVLLTESVKILSCRALVGWIVTVIQGYPLAKFFRKFQRDSILEPNVNKARIIRTKSFKMPQSMQ